MKTTFFLTLLGSVFLSSCGTSGSPETSAAPITYDELGKAYFLLGEWQNITPEGILTEKWERQNDSVYAGSSYFVSGKDTSFSETIKVEQRGNQVFYTPTVHDQNGGLPVEFKLSEASPTYLSFENPQHDFPSKITYTLVTKDSLVAEIFGNMNGKANTQQFPMKRLK